MTCLSPFRAATVRTRLLSRLDQQLAEMHHLYQQVVSTCDRFPQRDECRQLLVELAVEIDRDRYRLAEHMDELPELA